MFTEIQVHSLLPKSLNSFPILRNNIQKINQVMKLVTEDKGCTGVKLVSPVRDPLAEAAHQISKTAFYCSKGKCDKNYHILP